MFNESTKMQYIWHYFSNAFTWGLVRNSRSVAPTPSHYVLAFVPPSYVTSQVRHEISKSETGGLYVTAAGNTHRPIMPAPANLNQSNPSAGSSIASQCLQNTISLWVGSTCLTRRSRLLFSMLLIVNMCSWFGVVDVLKWNKCTGIHPGTWRWTEG